jgi:hypothetical protein
MSNIPGDGGKFPILNLGYHAHVEQAQTVVPNLAKFHASSWNGRGIEQYGWLDKFGTESTDEIAAKFKLLWDPQLDNLRFAPKDSPAQQFNCQRHE